MHTTKVQSLHRSPRRSFFLVQPGGRIILEFEKGRSSEVAAIGLPEMHNPLLYQLNTRTYLGEISRQWGLPASFNDIPDVLLDQLAGWGFEWIYLLGIWQTGVVGRAISESNVSVLERARTSLPNFCLEDIIGSPFSVKAYEPNQAFGGEASFAQLRQRARRCGLKVMLDFVPNHIAPDHEWVLTHPEFLIAGTEEDIAREPQNWARVETPQGSCILAFGRDPCFSGWCDTLQLNYRHPECKRAMMDQLAHIAELCDGVRCDMAMLVEPDIFLKTWGHRALPKDNVPPQDRSFWPEAITRVRQKYPSFTFMAEVYWDMEWRLQQEGFDFTYDKRLYDRLREGNPRAIREHLLADPDFQNRSARFLENHDEPRAASTFQACMHYPAALITFFSPGLRFFHDGQIEGWKNHVSMHVARFPPESVNPITRAFYQALLRNLRRPEIHEGEFHLWQPQPAWEGNDTWDNFISCSWHDRDNHCSLIVVNYSSSRGQCYIPIDLDFLAEGNFRLSDQFSTASYDRSGAALKTPGLYLDIPPWGYHLFEVAPVLKATPIARKVPAPIEPALLI